ncbi:MAG: hypothetical protein A2498_02295 [Lentisphaerae bacterium RIFOXYC12_FULL_60_16]|nr:MAG: hypothetical protein A2498_02295 [Lentisphaerae bacterium RIFOXYC12_FULL_60_16]
MQSWEVPFKLSNPWKFPLHGVPLRASIPLPEGEVRDPARELRLEDEAGHDCHAQWRILSTWKDGSARFVLMDYAQAELAPRTTRAVRVVRCNPPAAPALPAGIQVYETADTLTVDTGRLAWTFSKVRFTLGESAVLCGRNWLDGQLSDSCVMDAAGQVYRASAGAYAIRLEESGPHRVVVRIDGDFRGPAGTFMNYHLRLHFTAGGSQVLMLHHIRNRHAGREGRMLRRAWLEGGLAIDAGRSLRRVLHQARTVFTLQAMVEIPERVDIDVGPYETAIRNGVSLREDPNDICWSLRDEHPRLGMQTHRHCGALIDIVEPGAGGVLIKFAMPDPNREEPMALHSEGNRFEVDLFPDNGVPFHFGEGMGKTRDILFNFHDETLMPMDRFHESANLSYPGMTAVPRSLYRESRFADVHLTLEPKFNQYPLLETKIDMIMAAANTYDWPVATGWRDWGDEIGARGRCPEFGIMNQFINNEEDYLYCCMIDAWRLGKPYGGLAMARHVMDIDYIDFSEDPGRDGATCPHSVDHTGGEVYTSHQWCQGLLYFYLATGDEEVLRIARRVGDCLCWWIYGPRAYALRFSGRETAWPLLSLAALYDVTHEDKYRDAGLKIVDDLIAIREERGRLEWEYPGGSGIYSGYMIAMTFNGIWDVYAATGEKRVLDLWKSITGPVVEQLVDPAGMGYVHFRNWPLKWADLTVLVRWYQLTGDRRYVDLGRNGLRLILAGCPQPLHRTQGLAAMGYRHFILFLKLADEFGLINDDHCTLVW